MCGIVGIYYKDPERSVSEDLIRTMCDTIRHRGPDGEGIHIDRNFGMGMRRLAIIDIDGGRQPIFNEDKSISTVFNGEIYNYIDLRKDLLERGHEFRTKSDTECLVHGYETWGVELPKYLNGMFAFAIWDSRSRKLSLSRDHIGIKPLYIYQDRSIFAWASEIKALLKVPEINAELDQKAFLDFLKFGYVPGPRTMFRNIEVLPPATILTIQNNRQSTIRYWSPSFQLDLRPKTQWCEELRALIDDAVSHQLMSDVPLGAFLSGGIDSSTIVASMRHLGTQKISTYAIGFGSEDAFHSELSKASLLSKQFDTEHHEIIVDPDVANLLGPLIYHMDQPVTDTSFLVTYLVSKLAREHVKVILSGVGGDEIFAGYRRYLWPKIQALHNWIPRNFIRDYINPIASSLPIDRGSSLKASFRYLTGYLRHAHRPDSKRYQGYVQVFDDEQIHGLLSAQFAQSSLPHESNHVAHYYDDAPTDSSLNRMLYADINTTLVDSLLAFTDKMTMSVSLEARVPLLDHRVVELLGHVPPDVKFKGLGGYKHLLKQTQNGRLPTATLNQRKQGFGTPISRWFRGPLRPLIYELLSPTKLASRGLFEYTYVSKLIDQHMNQRADHSEHILALLTFEIWHQQFIDFRAA